jgi:hypothetical protein
LAGSAHLNRAEPGDAVERVGVVWVGEPGVTEMVIDLVEREARTAKFPSPPQVRKPFLRPPPRQRQNPSSPAVSRWGLQEEGAEISSRTPKSLGGGVSPLLPQAVGTNFKAISLLSPSESPSLPPDSMGDVGPTQILAMSNGRIKVFDKTGAVGGLNVSDSTFFTSVRNGASVTDPQVRYDRLSGRWFVTEITTTSPNRILIAVSSGSTITDTSSFTFFFFQHDLVGPTPNSDTGGFADYDSLGVDRFALYVGVNVFNAAKTVFLGSTGYVVNKASLLGGSLAVTPFRQIGAPTGVGLLSPRGVNNDDPQAIEGYFIGVDNEFFGQIDIRRVSSPGGTPSLSGVLDIVVPTTSYPIKQIVQGSAANRRLDGLDDRLFAAAIRRNKITGLSTLWTAHAIEVSSIGLGVLGGGRNGSRWYEITDLETTPDLRQSGTLFDPATTGPRGFWIDTVAASGQGHMALGSSYASIHDFAGVATAGRLRTDALGSTRAATLAKISTMAYNAQALDGQRWGDYSQTVVDPADDMTIWTFQEWCDATNSWGVQVVQLKAPPPATPASVAPSSVCAGLSSVSVAVIGSSSSGSEFFDPGLDAGGPGFAGHISASVSGGVSVGGIAFTDPTHVTLNLSTVGALTGPKNVTITNPDGQSSTGSGVLTIGPFPAPAVSSTSPACAGGTLQLMASSFPGAAYSWTGPNGFASSAQNPSIPNVTAAASGTYSVTYTAGGCASNVAMTTVTVIANGAACDDANACTLTDTCQAGACTGANPVVCGPAGPCIDVGVCDQLTGLCPDIALLPDDTVCADGDACTSGDSCQSGVCVSTVALSPAVGSPATAGSAPYFVVKGEFNADGRPDLAVANYFSNDVTILLGNGSGGFAPSAGSPFGAGLGPTAIAVGDFNRDGRSDLAVAGNSSGDVTVLLGNGSGGFAQPAGSPISTGPGPISVAVADFNLDLKPDLAVADNLSNDVTILLGNGSGGFAQAAGSPVNAGSGPVFVAAGQLDGDGRPDLAVANNQSNNVTILLGDGAGGFTQPPGSPVGAGAGPYAVAVGDLNGGGGQDLVVANNQSNSLTILLGDGSGGFSQPAGSPIPVGSGPASVAVADFNLDGRPDLAVANSGSDTVAILIGDGTGRFGRPPGPAIGAGSSPFSIALGDFNLDGKPDLAAADFGLDAVTILLGNPSLAPDGTACDDGNVCTAGDVCAAGLCHAGVQPGDADGDGHPAALCGGDDCNDADPMVWSAPMEVTGLAVSPGIPTGLSWAGQGVVAGPGTIYDLVSGTVSGSGAMNFPGAACLQSGGTTYMDARPDPGPGTARWYLARARNSCGVGTYGTSQRDTDIPPCP